MQIANCNVGNCKLQIETIANCKLQYRQLQIANCNIGNCNTIDRQLQHNLGNCNTTRNLGEKSKNKSIYSYAMYMGKKTSPTCRPGLHGTWWKLYVLAEFELQIIKFAARCVACLWCPGMWVTQSYKQTRSARHVVEVVRPGCVRAPDFRPGVWPACGAQGCESLRQSSGSVPVRD